MASAPDDRKAMINGVYVKTPEGDDYTGAAINSQNGLMYLFHQFRDVKKKYRAFDIGLPTKENIVLYKNKTSFISLPVEITLKDIQKQLNKNLPIKYLRFKIRAP